MESTYILTTDGELYHYGVKGMKWGVRKKTAEASSGGFKEGANIAKTVSRKAGKSKKVKNDISSMSDQELRERINRMNMEQQYAKLNPSKTAKGAEYASTILEVAGSVAAIGGSIAAVAVAIHEFKEHAI